jgi:hypothetical protein
MFAHESFNLALHVRFLRASRTFAEMLGYGAGLRRLDFLVDVAGKLILNFFAS